MKLKNLFVFFLFFLLAGARISIAAIAEDGDVGFWIRTDAEKKLNSAWKMNLGEELRFREHAGLSYEDTHIGAAWQACKYFLAGADYLQVRQTRQKGNKDLWYWESRPRIYGTPQITIRGWKLEDRNMLEFRIKEDIRDSLRYRQQMSVTAPWKWTRFEIQPQIFDEMFFETHRRGLLENRLFSGFKVHLWKPLYGTVGYLRQSQKASNGDWKDANIFVTTLKASL